MQNINNTKFEIRNAIQEMQNIEYKRTNFEMQKRQNKRKKERERDAQQNNRNQCHQYSGHGKDTVGMVDGYFFFQVKSGFTERQKKIVESKQGR